MSTEGFWAIVAASWSEEELRQLDQEAVAHPRLVPIENRPAVVPPGRSKRAA